MSLPVDSIEKIEKVNKFPLAFALIILGGLVGVFSNKLFDSSDQQLKDKDNTIFNLNAQLVEKDKNCSIEITFWKLRYLNQLEYSANQMKKQDSMNRIKLEKPNRDLSKVIKRRNNE